LQDIEKYWKILKNNEKYLKNLKIIIYVPAESCLCVSFWFGTGVCLFISKERRGREEGGRRRKKDPFSCGSYSFSLLR
jgi:hypothetical protein